MTDPARAPHLLAVDHIGLAVPDLDAAIALHTTVLGLTLVHREENADQQVVEAMLSPGANLAATQIQLLAPLTPDSPVARFLRRSGPGMHHVAYRVSNVETAAAYLRGRNLPLLYDAARSGTRGSRINFLHPRNTGGVLIELVEAPAGSTQRDAAPQPG